MGVSTKIYVCIYTPVCWKNILLYTLPIKKLLYCKEEIMKGGFNVLPQDVR